MCIFSLFGKKVGLWYGKLLSYINWFTTNGKKQVYQDTISDDSNPINFKTSSTTDKTDNLFIKAKDTTYLAADDEILTDQAPIILVAGDDYPIGIFSNDYSGEILICYTRNGVPHIDRYTNQNVPNFLADEDTDVAIFGDIKKLYVYSAKYVRCYRSSLKELYIQEESEGMHYAQSVTLIGNAKLEFIYFENCIRLKTLRILGNTALVSLLTTNCYALTKIELENNPKLEHLDLTRCNDLEVLDVSKVTNLKFLTIDKCYSLSKLNISGNFELQGIYFSQNNDYAFSEIKAHAFSEYVANAVVRMVQNAKMLAPGTVYIGRNDQYKYIIENAVENIYWWTIKYYV